MGVVLVYWGVRGWMRGKQAEPRLLRVIQAVSLALLGAAVVGVAIAGVRYTALLLSIAGASLVLRGLLASVYLLRRA